MKSYIKDQASEREAKLKHSKNSATKEEGGKLQKARTTLKPKEMNNSWAKSFLYSAGKEGGTRKK